jgi:hypothetical protein
VSSSIDLSQYFDLADGASITAYSLEYNSGDGTLYSTVLNTNTGQLDLSYNNLAGHAVIVVRAITDSGETLESDFTVHVRDVITDNMNYTATAGGESESGTITINVLPDLYTVSNDVVDYNALDAAEYTGNFFDGNYGDDHIILPDSVAKATEWGYTGQIEGGQGNDHLEGGMLADTFIFNVGDGLDVVENFVHDTALSGTPDFIDLTDYGIANFMDIQDAMQQDGQDVIIKLDELGGDSGDSITLLGINTNDLTDNDFII